MWNRFCTMAQSQCTDGKTDKSELLCSYWDSVGQECVMVTQTLLSVDYYRKVFDRIDERVNMKQEMF